MFRAVAASVVHHPEHTEDVLQEAFARLLRRDRTFKTKAEAFHYIRTTVLNTAIDCYRRLRRERRVQVNEISEDVLPGDESYSPFGLLIEEQESEGRNRLFREINKALRELPAQEREALAVFFDRRPNRTMKQVCLDRGIAYSTLRGRMLRSIDRIRLHLRKNGVEGFDSEEEES